MRSHLRLLIDKKHIFSLFVLLVLLYSTVSHSAHSEYFDLAEQHECQLCQQSIDTPPDNTLTVPIHERVNVQITTLLTGIIPLTKSYTLPLLRAPPYFPITL